MEWSTHLLSGVVAGYIVTGGDYRGAIVGGVAGVLPDVDEPNSKFGKVLFPISYPINNLVGHRTLTHSLPFALLLGLMFFVFVNPWVAYSIVAGIVAHAIGDMLTGKVKFLYPLNKSIGIRVPLALFRPIDLITRFALIIVTCVIIYKEFTFFISSY